MNERYQTLGAVLALGEFSVSELAELSGVREPTVRTILRREGTLVEQLGTHATVGRGGQPVRWRLRPGVRDQLRAELRELEQSGVGPWLTDQDDHDTSRAGIIAAEDVLLSLASKALNSDGRAELIKLAEAQLDAATASMSASHDAQVSAANRSLDRGRRIVELLLTLEQVKQDTVARRDRIMQEARVQAEELTSGARSRAEELEREAQQRYRRATSEISAIQEETSALTHQRDALIAEIAAMTGEWMPSLATQVASSAIDVFALGLASGTYEGTPRMASGKSAISGHPPDERSTHVKDNRKATASESGSSNATNPATWTSYYLRAAAGLDCLSALAAGFLGFEIRFGGHGYQSVVYLAVSTLLPVLWIASVALAGGYDARLIGVGSDEFRKILNAAVGLTAGIALCSYAARLEFLRGYLVLALPVTAAFDLLARYWLRQQLYKRRRSGRYMRRTVAVGHAAPVADLMAMLRRDSHHGLSVVAACMVSGSQQGEIDGIPIYSGLESVGSAVRRFNADTVAVLASPEMNGARLRDLAWDLEKTGTEMYVASALLDVVGPRTTIRPVAGLPLLNVGHPELAGTRQVIKGVFDRVLAALALILLSPLFTVIALAIVIVDGRPVFFRQVRVGRDEQAFRLWKFRTMVTDAEARKAELLAHNEGTGVLFKIRRDPRVTRTGAALRRWSLDELPQLFNVVLGEMSLVGPRPAQAAETAKHGDRMRRRLAVKPGITGLWQVSGRSDLSWDEEQRLEDRYVDNWSLALDVQILWKTLSAVLRGSGAY